MLGGTFVNNSPTIIPFVHVLLPALKLMGANVSLDLHKPGYFPDVVGEVRANI